ncbi:hypothetical protein MVG78_16475 [Roseomonas gilardii subsp. gilardii]|uniref:hypothetical protein n=1 Tax=Roseomonas gilardii TaxID=257708 RepID=UPI001FF9D115|nr:hypothetical protein [Roseomonas gilardii]UPG72104.1 hypothetical protein MVG78_16475 [Roseomonas gilardii subsp. gilardii]
MKKIALVLLVALAGCSTTPKAPEVVDPLEAYRPACKEKWQTLYAIEKCAQAAYDQSRGLPAVGDTPAASTDTTDTSTTKAATTPRGRSQRR